MCGGAPLPCLGHKAQASTVLARWTELWSDRDAPSPLLPRPAPPPPHPRPQKAGTQGSGAPPLICGLFTILVGVSGETGVQSCCWWIGSPAEGMLRRRGRQKNDTF